MPRDRTTTTKSKGIIWIPPTTTPVYKLTVTRHDGTEDDITNLISRLEIEDGVTEFIGKFNFEIYNPVGTYSGVWTGMEVVNYYADYASTATTLRFRGRIEKPSYMNNKIRVSGRSESLKFMSLTVTQSFDDQECSEILKSLISTYGTGFTSTNVEASTTNMTANWYQKPFWECVQELCSAAGFDCYVDSALDFHFFEIGSRENTDEGIVHDKNLISVGDFANDTSIVKNRVIIYGAEQDGTRILHTEEDIDSQILNFLREEIVYNTNVTSEAQAQDLAVAKLAESKNPPLVGEVKGILLATIQPGQKIVISSPVDNLNPGLYDVVNYKHNIGGSDYFTTVNISKQPRRITHAIKSLFKKTEETQDMSLNPYAMGYSYNFLFNSDTGTHTATEISDGVLKISSGNDAGSWISASRSTTSSVSEVYLYAIGDTISGATFYVSGNDGADWEEIDSGSKITLSDSIGTNFRIKVILNDTSTKVDSLLLLYSLT